MIIRAREIGDQENDLVPLPSTPNTVKDSRGRTIRVCFRQTDRDALPTVLREEADTIIGNPFVPLSVVGDTAGVAEKKLLSANAGITITTPGGYSLTLASADDLVLFEQTLRILENKAKC